VSVLADKVAEIEGFPVWLITIPINERFIELREKQGEGHGIKCPLCLTGWTNHVPTDAKTLISNGALFPNSMCHQGCIEHEGGMQAAAEKLKVMYDECKAARDKFVPLGWLGTWPVN
jgi:hypothetical protein